MYETGKDGVLRSDDGHNVDRWRMSLRGVASSPRAPADEQSPLSQLYSVTIDQ